MRFFLFLILLCLLGFQELASIILFGWVAIVVVIMAVGAIIKINE